MVIYLTIQTEGLLHKNTISISHSLLAKPRNSTEIGYKRKMKMSIMAQADRQAKLHTFFLGTTFYPVTFIFSEIPSPHQSKDT